MSGLLHVRNIKGFPGSRNSFGGVIDSGSCAPDGLYQKGTFQIVLQIPNIEMASVLADQQIGGIILWIHGAMMSANGVLLIFRKNQPSSIEREPLPLTDAAAEVDKNWV
ncbi:hypothetical protein SAMN05216420_10528 [Nitrosospira sp. Nl5]|nr:hypothetical protein SAMN05216420_10528 [Nitrosospira sp. Nl5]